MKRTYVYNSGNPLEYPKEYINGVFYILFGIVLSPLFVGYILFIEMKKLLK